MSVTPTSDSPSPLVCIEHVDFAYGPQLVLKQIDLDITAGTSLGIAGPNGGGKTTLVKLLLGQLTPTRGKITIGGLSPRQAIGRGDWVGYLPQLLRVPEQLPITVRQMVRLGLAGKTGMFKLAGAGDLAFAESVIELVGLKEAAENVVQSLSGGQLQRMFIARALVSRPRLLLLDEPTTGIDTAGQQRFIEFLSELKSKLDLTVVLISHDPHTIKSVCGRVVELNVTMRERDQTPAS